MREIKVKGTTKIVPFFVARKGEKLKTKYRKLSAQMVLKGDRQEDLADYLQMSLTWLNRKLSGDREFTLSEIKQICKRYKKTFEELF